MCLVKADSEQVLVTMRSCRRPPISLHLQMLQLVKFCAKRDEVLERKQFTKLVLYNRIFRSMFKFFQRTDSPSKLAPTEDESPQVDSRKL
jgi:hypothetical protein